MGILDLCAEYFDQRDIYQLLEVPKDAPLKDIKKAYYKLSLQVHPDRVAESEKAAATEKFKVLSKVYQVLTDEDKRKLYDEKGVIDDDEDWNLESKINSWLDLWRCIFKPLTVEDITNYQKSYIGSELERSDIKKSYLRSKGCINQMMNDVPFLQVEDEPRLHEIVNEMIAANEVPEYTIFTNEPAQKRSRRHKKYARESKQAEEIKKMNKESNSNLEQAIMQRQKSRESNYNTLMDKLMEKYGGGGGGGSEDDSELFELDKKIKMKQGKKQKTPAKKKSVAAGASTSKSSSVKRGKVAKR